MGQEIHYKPIGIIHTPFKTVEGTPIQPAGALGIEGRIEVFPEYAEGLRDLDGFSHIVLIYHFHVSRGGALIVRPYMDTEERGVFATRSPRRPNPIGLSVVRLKRIDGNTICVQDVDIVDGTPFARHKALCPRLRYERGSSYRVA